MAETYTGEVRNGVVVFDEGATPPPEGTKVRIELTDLKTTLRELSERLLELAGTVEGLPEDYAENLDHYVHGLRSLRSRLRPLRPSLRQGLVAH